MVVTRGALLIVLLVPFVLAADPDGAPGPIVDDPCGDNGTWMEVQFDRMDTPAEGEPGHDIDAVWVSTLWTESADGTSAEVAGVEFALDLCGDVPDADRPKVMLYLNFSAGPCDYQVEIRDELIVRAGDPSAGVERLTQLHADCPDGSTVHDGSASTAISGDLITWTLHADVVPEQFAFGEDALLTGVHAHTISAPAAGVWLNDEYGNVVVHNDDVSSAADFVVGSDPTT